MLHSFILQAHLVRLEFNIDFAKFEGMRSINSRVTCRRYAPQQTVNILVPLVVANARLALIASNGILLHFNFVYLYIVPII